RGRNDAEAGKPCDAAYVPCVIWPARKDAKGNALGNQFSGFTALYAVADRLQVFSDFPRHHLQVAGAKHAGGSAEVGQALKRHRTPALVHRAAGRKIVLGTEGDKVKALAQNKNSGGQIAAATGNAVGLVVASG